jgi:phosphopantetheine--protein transferase-like protein
LFESPFGSTIAFAVKTIDEVHTDVLYPEESKIISSRAVPKRKREFCWGRAAAHAVLEELDYGGFPVLKGKRNEPIWPENVVGAISHSGELAMAAAAQRTVTAGIGIDIERVSEKVSMDIARRICSDHELDWVYAREEEARVRMFMVFSAKESIFKAFSSTKMNRLDFTDAELIWDSKRNGFRAHLLKALDGACSVSDSIDVGVRQKEDYVFTYTSLSPLGSNR